MENNKKVMIIYNDKEKKDEEFYTKFIEALKSEDKVFELKDCVVDGDVDFLEIYRKSIKNKNFSWVRRREPDGSYYLILNIKINFKNVEFKGDVKFHLENDIKPLFTHQIIIDCCTFRRDIDFNNSIFDGEINFRDSTFEGVINFWKSEFKGDIYFERLTFKKSTIFENTAFEKNVYVIDSVLHYEGEINFRDSRFKKYMYFEKLAFEGNVYFENSTFNGKIDFKKLKFGRGIYFNGSIFEKEVNFEYSLFQLGVDFSGSVFKENIYFEYSKFEAGVEFYKSIFDGKVNFTSSIFLGTVGFEKSEFNEEVSFEKSEFLGNVNFWKSIFVREVNFTSLKFNGNVNFSELFFKDRTVFSNVKVYKKADFATSVFNEVQFVDVKFKFADFTGCVFEKLLLFSRVSSNLIKFTGAIFEGVAYFMENENTDSKQISLFDLFKNKYLTKNSKITGIALFNFVNFKSSNNITFVNFPLSNISFLLTDVKDITIITKAEKIIDEILLEFTDDAEKMHNIKEKIVKTEMKVELYYWDMPEVEKNKLNKRLQNYRGELEEVKKNLINRLKQKIYFEDEELYISFADEFVYGIFPYLKPETIAKEYNNIRKSFENNRTYIEASKLFICEMNLIRKITIPYYEKYKLLWSLILILLVVIVLVFGSYISTEFLILLVLAIILLILCFLEGIAFDIYKIISNYGESITRPIIFSIIIILAFPYIVNFLNWVWIYVIGAIPFLKESCLVYEQTLRAFFQLGINEEAINTNKELQTLASYEWLIRIISLILLGNIFIAIKRRLERK
jgi:uncharacterized protein YjbI with pentapeptide repeats